MKIFRTKENWEELFKEHKVSGKRVSDFCREKGIHQNLFYRKRKELSGKGSFVRLPVEVVSSGKIQIRIKDVIIEPGHGYDKQELALVINTVLEAVDAEV